MKIGDKNKYYVFLGKMRKGWYYERNYFCDLVKEYRGNYSAIRWIKKLDF